MVTWVNKIVANDPARKWVDALVAQQGFDPIAKAFSRIPRKELIHLEPSPALEALAAAEIVAALFQVPSLSLPDNVAQWLKGKPQPNPQLAHRAIEVVDFIFDDVENYDDSEIRFLWEESEEDFLVWTSCLEELRSRLAMIQKRKP